MLYGKIYLDEDENGKNLLVFDTSTEDDGFELKVAGEKKTKSGRTSFRYFTTIYDSRKIAISEEAKEKLLYKIDNESKVYCFEGDFRFSKESFEYVPKPFGNGQTKRALADGELLTIEVGGGISFECIERMIILENEAIKAMDISTPVDETPLLQAYFESRRERGLDTACDAETICRVQTKHLTAEQKSFIKTYYKNSCNGYDSADWHYHGDFIYNEIISDMASHFGKSFGEIEQIIESR